MPLPQGPGSGSSLYPANSLALRHTQRSPSRMRTNMPMEASLSMGQHLENHGSSALQPTSSSKLGRVRVSMEGEPVVARLEDSPGRWIMY